MTIYNVNLHLGQALVEAESEEQAEDYSCKEWGEYNAPFRVEEATEDAISWVLGMGGIIHHAN